MKFTNKTKTLALLMALMLMITALFAGCGGEDKKDDEKKEETTVAEEKTTKAEKETEADVDEEVEDEAYELGEPDSGAYIAPGTKGFTLDQIETALVNFAESCDIFYLDQFTLYQSEKILEYMKSKENSANSSEYDDDSMIEHFGIHNFDELRDAWMYEDAPSFESIRCSIENDLDEYSEYFGEYAEKNLFDTTKEAVEKIYTNGKVTFVSLSYGDIQFMETAETGFYYDIFIIETNVGYFLLLEIPDITN